MYSGAVRAGKTVALCLKTVVRAMRPGAREILCRKTLTALQGTTLRTLLDGDGNTPPVLPPGTYVHNRQQKIIRIIGGGEIVYFALADVEGGVQQRAGSYSATGVNIDEATELEAKDYRMLVSRASVSVPGLPRQVNMACNPGPPSHHLAKRFAPPGSGYTVPMRGCVCIPTQTQDNTFLDPEYVEMLNREIGTLWHRRFVLGLWCGSQGVVYNQWDRARHAILMPDWNPVRAILCVDDGYAVPFAVSRIEQDGDGRLRVTREVYEREKQEQEQVDYIRRVAESGIEPECVIIDPAAAKLRGAISLAGFAVVPADNAVFDGIKAVQQRLAARRDGHPGLTVAPECTNTIREFETYEWKVDRLATDDEHKHVDEPIKRNDHLVDTIRYGVMHLDNHAERVISDKAMGHARQELESPLYLGDVRFFGEGIEDISLRKRRATTLAWVDADEGPWRIWCDLVKDGSRWRPHQLRTYCIACNCAPLGDSTMIAVCRETREQVGEFSAAGMAAEDFARAAVRAALWLGGSTDSAYLIWRGDGYGRAFGPAVTRTLQYGHYYRDIDEGRSDRLRSKRPGWHASTPKTIELVESFHSALLHGKFIPRSQRLLEQTRGYVWFDAGRIGPVSLQDADASALLTHADLVLPAMLANYGLSHVGFARVPDRKAPYGSPKWFEAREAEKDGDAKREWWL